LGKKIIVVDSLDTFISELKGIGRNLNQPMLNYRPDLAVYDSLTTGTPLATGTPLSAGTPLAAGVPLTGGAAQ
jgi:hypothetical protein